MAKQKHTPTDVKTEIVVNPTPSPILDRPVIQPVSVEVTSARPTRVSSNPAPVRKNTGAFLIEKTKGNKRTWMDRKMAELMAKTNPSRYAVED